MSSFGANQVTPIRAEMLHASTLENFCQAGCFRTRTQDIVEQIGFGKSSLYQVHPSRADLFAAAHRHGVTALRSRCLELSRVHAPEPIDVLRRVVAELLTLNQQCLDVSPATLQRLRCCSHWLGSEPASSVSAPSWFTEVVETWKDLGVVDPAVDSRWLAAVVVALTSSAEIGSAVPGGDGATRLADRVVDLLWVAYGPGAVSSKG